MCGRTGLVISVARRTRVCVWWVVAAGKYEEVSFPRLQRVLHAHLGESELDTLSSKKCTVNGKF